MQQLLLDIDLTAAPSFDNFIVGDNGEILQAARSSAAGSGTHLYLWGEAGSGRSHLLQATVAQAEQLTRPARYLAKAQHNAALPKTTGMLLAIDEVDTLSEPGQINLFNAFNRARTLQQTLLIAGATPPLQLALREDLRTRIGQCLIYQIRPFDDATRLRILATLAQRRGLHLPKEVAAFLLRHGQRNLPHLVSILDALSETSLSEQRPITLPLLRQMISKGLQI